MDFDHSAVAVYGGVRASLERKGAPIEPMDQLLAAQALSQNLLLVTNSKRELRHVAGLQSDSVEHGTGIDREKASWRGLVSLFPRIVLFVPPQQLSSAIGGSTLLAGKLIAVFFYTTKAMAKGRIYRGLAFSFELPHCDP